MVPNSQLGGLESPTGAKLPAQSETANDRGSTGIRTPGDRVTCNLQPKSDTLTTWPSCLSGVLENKCLKNLHQNVLIKYQWSFISALGMFYEIL